MYSDCRIEEPQAAVRLTPVPRVVRKTAHRRRLLTARCRCFLRDTRPNDKECRKEHGSHEISNLHFFCSRFLSDTEAELQEACPRVRLAAQVPLKNASLRPADRDDGLSAHRGIDRRPAKGTGTRPPPMHQPVGACGLTRSPRLVSAPPRNPRCAMLHSIRRKAPRPITSIRDAQIRCDGARHDAPTQPGESTCMAKCARTARMAGQGRSRVQHRKGNADASRRATTHRRHTQAVSRRCHPARCGNACDTVSSHGPHGLPRNCFGTTWSPSGARNTRKPYTGYTLMAIDSRSDRHDRQRKRHPIYRRPMDGPRCHARWRADAGGTP